MDTQNNLTPPILEWNSLDSHPHTRGKTWYTTGSIFVLLFACYGLWDGSWTTTVVALLIGAMYFMMRNRPPQTIPVRIDGLGIVVAGIRHPWNTCKDFWILAGDRHAEMHVSRSSAFSGEILVFIDDLDPAIVRETMLRFVHEREGMEERYLDYFARILKL